MASTPSTPQQPSPTPAQAAGPHLPSAEEASASPEARRFVPREGPPPPPSWEPGVIEVQFRDDIQPTVARGAAGAPPQLQSTTGVDLGAVQRVLARHPLRSVESTFGIPARQAASAQASARQRGYEVPRLDSFLTLRFAPDADVQRITEELRALPEVEQAMPVPRVLPPFTPLDEPLVGLSDRVRLVDPGAYLEGQWYVFRNRADRAWRHASGRDVVIADIDWGYRVSHEELQSRLDMEHAYNSYDGSQDVSVGSNISHGTSVMGLAGGADNGQGMSGYAPEAILWPIQANTGTGSPLGGDSWARAIEWVRTADSQGRRKVIILEVQTGSYGNIEQWLSVNAAIRTAIADGVVVCVAAGNGNRDASIDDGGRPFTPTGSILVGATQYNDTHDQRAWFSNFGPRITVCAPGDGAHDVTCASSSDTAYTNGFGGTSGATPKVAGTVALMLSVNPRLSHEQLRELLTRTGAPVTSEVDRPVGTFLDTEAAVRAALDAPQSLPARRLDDAAVEDSLRFAQAQLERTVSELSTSQYPHSTRPDGTWEVLPPDGDVEARRGWTQGFFPGCLWHLYARTGNPLWRERADAWTRPLEAQQANMLTADMGFKFMPSAGAGWMLTAERSYRQVALTAAGALASRFNPRVGLLSCCDWNERWHLPLVADTMMNLELLFWGATQNQVAETYQGQEGWHDMALEHALRTLEDLVRPDGSTYHVVDYEPRTGAIRSKETLRGAGAESTWSRGQAWVLYGFARAYFYTRDERMLRAAQRVADFYVSQLSGDFVPNWDFAASEQQKDSSAGAIAAAGLLELSTFVESGSEAQRRYWDAALNTLTSLMSSGYLARGTSSRAILLHGVGNKPAEREVDVGLIYGDFYFLEALRRYRQLAPARQWPSRREFSKGFYPLGATYMGMRTVEFDMVPHADRIDCVVGYADSATPITAYSSMAMLVRMNTSGTIDVRNGGAYQALARVTYSANRGHHVRLVANLEARSYSVWVRPEGGAEVQLAADYAFRSDAPATNDFDKVGIISSGGDDAFHVERHTVT